VKVNMSQKTLLAVAGYLPLLRFDKKAARVELRWSRLGGAGKGLRAVAGWDEDALTMAVEAARLVGADRAVRVTFASTSSAFTDRSQAGLLVDALHLDPSVQALDAANSRRAATSALIRAFDDAGDELVAAGEKRRVQPGSAQHLNWGDGAGAALVGAGTGVARLLGSASLNADLLDIYTSVARGVPYAAEDRFVRDQVVADIYTPTILRALAAAGVAAGDIALTVVPEPVGGTYRALAKACGLKAANLCEDIDARVGELGAAMPLVGLALALDRARAGDKILLAGFGNGCDVLVFEATATGTGATEATLGQGVMMTSYSRLLNLTGGIDLDWGPRSEVNQKVSASVLARHGREMHGFVGGRDTHGNVQFPKTPVPVNPAATGPEPYTDVVLQDVPGNVASITVDRLNYTPDPPFCFGLVQFENGARVVMEHCDIEGAVPAVGDAVRMRFRVKAIDRQRGFRSYFWKAAPIKRPDLSAEGK
jgi:hydroxymethylglutaryl-CoA synthase